MIKIVSITNCHAWDGKVMNLHEFATLLDLLKLSNFVHTISYYEDGELKINYIGN